MVACSSLSSQDPASVVSSVAPASSAIAIPDRGAARPLLPGRRRLMREEDSSGTDSEGEEEDNAVSPPLRELPARLGFKAIYAGWPAGSSLWAPQEGLRSVFLAGPGSF